MDINVRARDWEVHPGVVRKVSLPVLPQPSIAETGQGHELSERSDFERKGCA
jgi:hypothetical protein